MKHTWLAETSFAADSSCKAAGACASCPSSGWPPVACCRPVRVSCRATDTFPETGHSVHNQDPKQTLPRDSNTRAYSPTPDDAFVSSHTCAFTLNTCSLTLVLVPNALVFCRGLLVQSSCFCVTPKALQSAESTGTNIASVPSPEDMVLVLEHLHR